MTDPIGRAISKIIAINEGAIKVKNVACLKCGPVRSVSKINQGPAR
jgi:hypothetical protein